MLLEFDKMQFKNTRCVRAMARSILNKVTALKAFPKSCHGSKEYLLIFIALGLFPKDCAIRKFNLAKINLGLKRF